MDFIAVIRYHCWWPGSDDPYYNFNVPENRARVNYYGADYTPHLYIDGTIDAGSNSGAWRSRFLNEADVWSPLVMNITGTYDSEARTGEITVSIFAELDPGLSNLKLRVALVENNISWRAPNGTTIHNQTFRDMMPSTSGVVINISEGETVEETMTFSAPQPIEPNNCQLVAFVQSDYSRAILQGTKIGLPDLTPTGVDDQTVPEEFSLSQNYPNPFNANTRIDFSTAGGSVNLAVYNITGALVKNLASGKFEAGRHSIVWNGTDEYGSSVASGIYFYKIVTSEGSRVQRMTLLK